MTTLSKRAQITGASITLLLLVILGGLLFLDRAHESEDASVSVAATIFPLYDLTRQIAGDRVSVQLIIQPGVSEHSLEASPSLIQKLAGTEAVFFIGAGMDDWVKDVARDDAKLVDLSRHVSLLEVEETQEFPAGKDPHYWLSPQNVIVMAGAIRDELIVLQSKDKSAFELNYQTLVEDLQKLDKESRASLADLPSRDIATFHEGWSYFAAEYDLNIVATFEPFPGKTPSPERLAEYENAIRTHDLKIIFTEPQLASAALEQVAKDLNVRLDILDPVGGIAGRDSYRKLIEYNVSTIRNALIQNN